MCLCITHLKNLQYHSLLSLQLQCGSSDHSGTHYSNFQTIVKLKCMDWKNPLTLNFDLFVTIFKKKHIYFQFSQ